MDITDATPERLRLGVEQMAQDKHAEFARWWNELYRQEDAKRKKR